ncbi:MAG: RnfABCDGE type electron transport complex subunit B [Muribaculaceae bacterium]|nr:RnfABCDGE type electron transport complex subunit B [Muribaculaceae bacterium]
MSIIASTALLGGIGAVGSVVLFLVAKKFHVDEDSRVALIEEELPGANCGGCGCKGCRDFAECCVKAGSLSGLYCPVGGEQVMAKIAGILGVDSSAATAKVATVKCAGTPETKTPGGAVYQGPSVCSIKAMQAGDYECQDACLGCGDCVRVCQFSAIAISDETALPVVDLSRCAGCGQCVVACPRHIIEVIPAGVRYTVACSNCMKGAVARKQCSVACIACGKCVKACPCGAIQIVDNHAYIDQSKCEACGKCIDLCPTHAIRRQC